MDSARGLYSRLSGNNPDQDEEMDSLLSLPNVNPNQPREWLHIDSQGKTKYSLVKHLLTNILQAYLLKLHSVQAHAVLACSSGMLLSELPCCLQAWLLVICIL